MVNTFLPLPDFRESLLSLDKRRLGKQRLEAYQIINFLLGTPLGSGKGYANHPAKEMWKGYTNALIEYYNICLEVWVERGGKNEMKPFTIEGEIVYPPWFGVMEFHYSHQAALIRKEPAAYLPLFDTLPIAYLSLGYLWPSHIDLEDLRENSSPDIPNPSFFDPVNKSKRLSMKSSEYLLYTLPELKEIAISLGITKVSQYNKRQLYDLIFEERDKVDVLIGVISKLKVNQLRYLAYELGIQKSGKMKKEELIDNIITYVV